jgi:hypothetical protein
MNNPNPTSMSQKHHDVGKQNKMQYDFFVSAVEATPEIQARKKAVLAQAVAAHEFAIKSKGDPFLQGAEEIRRHEVNNLGEVELKLALNERRIKREQSSMADYLEQNDGANRTLLRENAVAEADARGKTILPEPTAEQWQNHENWAPVEPQDSQPRP